MRWNGVHEVVAAADKAHDVDAGCVLHHHAHRIELDRQRPMAGGVTGCRVIDRVGYGPPGVRACGRPVHDTSGTVHVPPGVRTHVWNISTSVGLDTSIVPESDVADVSQAQRRSTHPRTTAQHAACRRRSHTGALLG